MVNKRQQATDIYDELMRSTALTTFTVTDEHLALMRMMRVRWMTLDNSGGIGDGPAIDWHRPYGHLVRNHDIAHIVAGDELNSMDATAQDQFISSHTQQWERLHAETAIALQIALSTGQFTAGTYLRLGNGWRLDTAAQAAT